MVLLCIVVITEMVFNNKVKVFLIGNFEKGKWSIINHVSTEHVRTINRQLGKWVDLGGGWRGSVIVYGSIKCCIWSWVQIITRASREKNKPSQKCIKYTTSNARCTLEYLAMKIWEWTSRRSDIHQSVVLNTISAAHAQFSKTNSVAKVIIPYGQVVIEHGAC